MQVSIGLCPRTIAIRSKHFNLDNHLAIQGYDPVAYFKKKKKNEAVKGSKGMRR